MPRWVHSLATVLVAAAGVSAALVALGAIIAVAGDGDYRTTIASTLFVGGGIVFLWNAIAGGGAQGRRLRVYVHGTSHVAPEDALGWVGVGALTIGVGVAAAVL